MAKVRLALLILIVSSALCSCGVSAELQGRRQNPPAAPEKGQAQSESAQARAAVDPNKFAIVIAGVGGEEVYTKKFTAQASSLYDALTRRLGFDEKNVFMLTEAVAGGPEDASRENVTRATAEETRKAFEAVKQAARPDSLMLVVLIGHGSFDTQTAKFNLIGPDLSAKDYAGLVSALPAKRVIFVNCASSSGEFVKPLAGKDRIIITATRSGNEQNATTFAEHFIPALTDTAADADKNGRVSLLEAFNFATKLTADGYKQNGRLATEHALIEDNGDGAGHEEAKEGDGALAKTTYLDSKPAEQAGADAELARLLAERQKLEEQIEKLKARKEQMKADEYEAELERLLIELAKINQAIKARQK